MLLKTNYKPNYLQIIMKTILTDKKYLRFKITKKANYDIY